MTGPPDRLWVEPLSAATFGRGGGTTGEVDVEIDHDELGLPVLGAKAIHGLLRDAWLSMSHAIPELVEPGLRVLGQGGELDGTTIMRLGDARVQAQAREWLEFAVRRSDNGIHPGEVLAALTAIRRQTARERATGASAEGTLRATRILLPLSDLRLEAPVDWLSPPGPEELRCLGLAARAVRHAGLARNRGRGHVRLSLRAGPGRSDATGVCAFGAGTDEEAGLDAEVWS